MNNDSKTCKHCGVKIPKNRKFCSKSCAAKHNNRGVNRWKSKPSTTRIKESTGYCEDCGIQIDYSQLSDGKYYKRKFCQECLHKQLSQNGKKSVKRRIKTENQNDWSAIDDMTKQEVLEKSGGHTWTMKCTITRHARKTYKKASSPQSCKVCGYDKHIHVSHIKAIKDFSMDTKIGEINNIDNLVGLCPNHHWEFDHGLLNLGELNEQNRQESRCSGRSSTSHS
jgi:hypothetical protein